MAFSFTVEDGTGLSTANAYLSVADFKDHHTGRGNTSATDGTYGDTEIEAGIVRATDYVDKRFGRRFRGDKSYQTQELEWPRLDAYTDEDHELTGVPRQLEKAIAEYALITLQLARPLDPIPVPEFGILDPSTGEVTSEGGGKVIEKTEKVGPIEDTTKWGDTNRPMTGTGNATQNIPEYPQADLWLEEITEPYGVRSLARG